MTSHRSNNFPGRLLGLAAVVLVVVSGCSDRNKKVTVNGTVSHKGQPLTSGMLRFAGPEGAVTSAVIQSDGKFIMTDVTQGEVKVGLMQGPQGSGDSSGKKENQAQKPQAPLPSKYYDPETSGVKYTITSNTTQLNVEFP